MFLLTEQNNKFNARVQGSDGMQRKFFEYLCRHIIDNYSRGLQVGNRAKECQLNQAKPLVVKDKSYKLSKNQW